MILSTRFAIADTDAVDKWGQTLLQLAAERGHEAVVRQFLEQGADTEAADEDGRTPLSRAAKRGHKAHCDGSRG
jgi:ankyrin repeat protein